MKFTIKSLFIAVFVFSVIILLFQKYVDRKYRLDLMQPKISMFECDKNEILGQQLVSLSDHVFQRKSGRHCGTVWLQIQTGFVGNGEMASTGFGIPLKLNRDQGGKLFLERDVLRTKLHQLISVEGRAATRSIQIQLLKTAALKDEIKVTIEFSLYDSQKLLKDRMNTDVYIRQDKTRVSGTVSKNDAVKPESKPSE